MITLCTVAAPNIFSVPAGSTVVGQVPAGVPVQLMDGSLMRDYAFVGKLSQDGVSPRGWVVYAGLGRAGRRLRHAVRR